VPPAVQVKLLRVLQEREFERVGGNRTLRVDRRLVAATNRPLEQLVESRLFREDLYHRLNVIPIHLPPLRARSGDIPELARHFVAHFSRLMGKRLSLSDGALELLLRYDWPGNVRELRNVIERAAALADPEDLLQAEDLAFDFWGAELPVGPRNRRGISSPRSSTTRPRRFAPRCAKPAGARRGRRGRWGFPEPR
jgi:Nif-specific regulatory protein